MIDRTLDAYEGGAFVYSISMVAAHCALFTAGSSTVNFTSVSVATTAFVGSQAALAREPAAPVRVGA